MIAAHIYPTGIAEKDLPAKQQNKGPPVQL
jgi:hypothetical protein